MKSKKNPGNRVQASATTSQMPMLQWSSQAVLDVAAERCRQVEGEGHELAQDDELDTGELASAAAAYAQASPMAGEAGAEYGPCDPPDSFPWEVVSWKPGCQRRMLVKAGALILAEIERLDRKALYTAPKLSHDPVSTH